jgi:cell division GTPase FtsZ
MDNKLAKLFADEVQKPHLTLACHGGMGANAALGMMNILDPDQHNHLYFHIFETNLGVLRQHFWKKDSGDGNLAKWLATDRVSLNLLGDGLGAGGDPSVGESLLNTFLEEQKDVKAFLGNPYSVVQVGGGGGGTASGAMPALAKALKKLEIPTYSILTLPRYKEARLKWVKAKATMEALLAIGPTAVIRNENMPDKTPTYKGIYDQVNDACLFRLLGFLCSLTQDVGDVQDIDNTDWRRLLEVGNYTLLGFFDASHGFDNMEKDLIGNPYLQAEILENALGIALWFEGKWPVEDHDKVLDCLQKKMRYYGSDIHVEVKYGILEDGVPEGRKTVGFVAFAKESPSENDQGAKVQASASLPAATATLESEPLSETEPVLMIKTALGDELPESIAAESLNGNGHATDDVTSHEGLEQVKGPVGSNMASVWLSPEDAKQFRLIFTKNLSIFDKERIETLLAKVREENGVTFTPTLPWKRLNGAASPPFPVIQIT